MRRRVVITGLGPVCSIGSGAEAFWAALCAGQSALGPIQAFDATGLGPKLAGEVRDLKVRELVPKSYRKATKVMARDIELAVAAARLAAIDAGLVTRGSDDDADGFRIDGVRTGCHIGAGLISAEAAELSRAVASAAGEDGKFSTRRWGTIGDDAAGGMNNLPPLWLLKYLPNMLACHVTIIHGLEGPSNTIMSAEAGALQSLGESARVIERGSADVCFSGGAESRVNPMGVMRMELAGRIGATDAGVDDGSELVRPYAPGSIAVLGEGGGMLILEGADHAAARGARVYAEVAGYGSGMDIAPGTPGVPGSASAFDNGLAGAVSRAMADANIQPEQIDAIAPLALGMEGPDQREFEALRASLGEAAGRPLVTLTPMIGNTLAAHGGLSAAAAALAMHNQTLPGRVFRGNPSETGGAVVDECRSREGSLEHVLVCSGSFGGQAAALVLRRSTS